MHVRRKNRTPGEFRIGRFRITVLFAFLAVFFITAGLAGCGEKPPEGPYEAADPEFSAEAGAYDEAGFRLKLSAPKGYSVYYTTDGSVPTEESVRYKKPIQLASPQPGPEDLAAPDNAQLQYENPGENLLQDASLPAAMVVRAIAVAPDGTAGNIVTKSYFMGMSLSGTYGNLPVLSVTADPKDLLDYDTGILVKGRVWDEWIRTKEGMELIAKGQTWDYEANFTQHGKEWERPASLELFDGADVPAFQENVGIRVRGGASRNVAQKSLTFYFRSDYGSKKLSCELIPSAADSEGKTIGEYKSFILRNGGNDHAYLRFKDYFLQNLLSDRAFDYQAGRPAILFLNGEYWGIYTLCEKFGSKYIEAHYPGIDGDDVVMFKEGELEEGEEEDASLYRELLSYGTRDLSDPAAWEEFCRLVDVENMADYFAAEIYIGNNDWDEKHNFQLWRTREARNQCRGDDGRWRFMLFDTENSSSLYDKPETDVSRNNYADALQAFPVFAAAMKNPSFRELFLQAVEEIGTVNFDPAKVEKQLAETAAFWQPFVQTDYLRFGDTSYVWDRDLNGIRNYFARRYEIITGYILEEN